MSVLPRVASASPGASSLPPYSPWLILCSLIVVWRGAGGSGGSTGVVMGGSNAPGGIYSGHVDGRILAWLPQLQGADDEMEGNFTQDLSGAKAKKRKALDDAFRSLMGKQITFSGVSGANAGPAPG